MFGVWGSRTVDGSLLSARNLDWNKDTGIQKSKLVTVFHPPGKYAHATLGFVGLYGALAGMSAKGVTVHEANLESNDVRSFYKYYLFNIVYFINLILSCFIQTSSYYF